MAEQSEVTAPQPELKESSGEPLNPASSEDMELEPAVNPKAVTNGESIAKRSREEDESEDAVKKQKVEENEKSMEEDRLEKSPANEKVEAVGEVKSDGNESVKVRIGPKEFGSSVEMFDYFFKLLHFWPANLKLNKYEYMVLLDLIKKGHSDPDRKVGGGVKAFEVRYHPIWKSKCFFVIRDDDVADDFSFRKCVDSILPLPASMKAKSDASGGRGHGGRGGGRGGHGRGRGGRSRN